MKNIIVLNGSIRKNGNTSKLVKAFKEGAEASGNIVKEFYLNNMNINECVGCDRCLQSTDKNDPCVQKDDMKDIYKAFNESDIVVFASPVYFWTITGPLKTAVDRLYSEVAPFGHDAFNRDSILLMTAGDYDYSQALNWYHNFNKYLDWKNLGEILGSDKIEEARKLGESIK